MLTRVFGTTQRVAGFMLEVVILLYFLLAARRPLSAEADQGAAEPRRAKGLAVQIARETETSISTYLLTTSLVNLCEGAVVAGAMCLWGMPSPFLWGALVVLLEFIPYLGAAAMVWC